MKLGKTISKDLPDKQSRFCQYYVLYLDATRAALKAGYSPDSAHIQGSQLLKNPKVKENIKGRMKDRARRLDITADNVLCELARIGFSNLTDIVTWDENDGVKITPCDDVGVDTTRAISELSETRHTTTGRNGDTYTDSRIKVKLHDKVKALDLIGRHIGLWKESGAVQNAVTINLAYNPKGLSDGTPAESTVRTIDAASSDS